MSIWYEISGEILLRDEDGVAEKLKKVEAACNRMSDVEMWVSRADGHLLVNVCEANETIEADVDELESAIKALAPHAADAGRFVVTYDGDYAGEEDAFYVGSDEQIARLKKCERMEAAAEALGCLSDDELEEFMPEYLKRRKETS